MTRRQIDKSIVALSAFTAVNAFGGSVYGLSGAPDVLRDWLRGSPFQDYRVPSVILGIAVGGTSTGSAIAAWGGSDRPSTATPLTRIPSHLTIVREFLAREHTL